MINLCYKNLNSQRLTFTLMAVTVLMTATSLYSANFTSGSAHATKFGVHEIVLTGNGSVSNPFDTICQVTFTPPAGNPFIVHAFYDGGNTWRARLYVSRTGTWSWSSSSSDSELNKKVGTFDANSSNLKGKLRQHSANPKALMTDNGQTFQQYSDTAYRLFNHEEDVTLWQAYIRDNWDLGINSVRVGCMGGYMWYRDHRQADSGNVNVSQWPWNGTDQDRFNLTKFQTTDTRLKWMLEKYPDMNVQLILFGLVEWGSDHTGREWEKLSQTQQDRTIRYMVARWAAFPQVFWLIVNDMHMDSGFQKNRGFTMEVGNYLYNHNPFGTLCSTGPNRGAPYPFSSEPWTSYIHLERESDLAAVGAADYADVPKPVINMEDRYEKDWGASTDPPHMDYFQRRLFIAWTLSGSSANYGGRFPYIHPYTQTGSIPAVIRNNPCTSSLKGLNHLNKLKAFFETIDLADYKTPADELVKNTWLDNNSGPDRAKCLRNGTTDYLIYVPNANTGETWDNVTSRRTASLNTSRQPSITVSLSDPGTYHVQWYNVVEGVTHTGKTIKGNGTRTLTSPWTGKDVLIRVTKADLE